MKRSVRIILEAGVLAGIVGLAACSGDSPTAIDAQEGGEQASSALPEAFGWFSDDVEAYVEGDYILLRSNGVPNRASPYFDNTGPFGEIQSLARLGYFVDLDDQTGYDREVIHTETLAFSPSSGGLPATDPRVRRALPWRRPPPPGRPLR